MTKQELQAMEAGRIDGYLAGYGDGFAANKEIIEDAISYVSSELAKIVMQAQSARSGKFYSEAAL